jgi:predicted Zn finger-like uncharacterized protein
MSAVNDEDLRYTFSCPSCAGSFSISLAKIPPVQARFSCPKCSRAMDFPSREEARVYIHLQTSGGGAAPDPPPSASAAPPPPPVAAPAPHPPVVASASAAPAGAPAPPVRPRTPPPAIPDPMDGTGTQSGKTYRLEKKGFERDEFDRRAMRTLIRTAAVNEGDMVAAGADPAVRADSLPELKSLFELRKTARFAPPPVCPAHTDRVAHYQCGDTGRPLCEECAEEKKFGGASVRVCAHCGGTAGDLHEAPGDIK